ncbi:hypothetical protein HK098_005774 [Nowakowskiella sp. JEL0407]|nr:hypothetical protein HK098_005774 [Nowakowskiella sp. JEL0407]
MNVDEECNQLVEEIKRLGSSVNGKFGVNFGVLFDDDRCQNIFEALVGTLRAAKKKKLINYDGQLLLKGTHDNTHSKHNEQPTAQLISKYHTISKEIAKLETSSIDEKIKQTKIEGLKFELENLGGLHSYQRASLKGGNEQIGRGAVALWVSPYLKEHYNTHNNGQNFKLLDVGALSSTTYSKLKNYTVTAIDLNPQSHQVLRQDFMERPIPANNEDKFNVVCLSLVLNFVPSPVKRGI